MVFELNWKLVLLQQQQQQQSGLINQKFKEGKKKSKNKFKQGHFSVFGKMRPSL